MHFGWKNDYVQHMRKYLSNVHKIGGTHLKCVNNEYTKFEYKGMKDVGVTDYTNQTPSTHFGWNKCLSPTPLKNGNILSNVHRIENAHLQYGNSHYAKF